VNHVADQANEPVMRIRCECGRWRKRIVIAGRLMPAFEACSCEGYEQAQASRDAKVKRQIERQKAENRQKRISRMLLKFGCNDKYRNVTLKDLRVVDLFNQEFFHAATEFAHGERQGLWAYGSVGTGKSIIERAALNGRIRAENGENAFYLSASRMIDLLRPSNGDAQARLKAHALEEYIFGPCKCLMIDDADKPNITPAYVALLFKIIEHYHMAKKKILITSNCNHSELRDKLKVANLSDGPAIVRRLMEICGKPFELTGAVWYQGKLKRRS